MLKLDKKRIPRPQNEWFGEVFNLSIVTNSYLVLWEFNTSRKELLLVSSRSISFLISGGDSGESWVLVHALGLLWLGRSARLMLKMSQGSLQTTPPPSQCCKMILPCNTHVGRRQSLSLSSLYWLPLRLVKYSIIQEIQWELANSSPSPINILMK